MTTRILLALLLLLVPAAAQDASLRKTLKDFEKAVKSDELAPRASALAQLVRFGDAKVVDGIVEAILDTSKRIAHSEKKIEKIEEAIEAELQKRVYKPKVSEAKKREALARTEEKLRPERDKVAKLKALLESDLAFRAACSKALPDAAASLDEEGRGQAADEIARKLDRGRKGEALVHYARALAAIEHPLSKAAMIENAANSLFPSVRVVCLDGLVRYLDDAAEAAGIRGLDDEYRQVRSAAIGLLRVIGGKQTVAAMIDRIGKAEGATLGELRSALVHIAKVDYNDNEALWKRWWAENANDFEGRGEDAGVPGAAIAVERGAGQGGTNFYGIETTAKNIVYVLDHSGSMLASLDGKQNPGIIGERRIDQAVRELIRSIKSLPSDGTFNIVFYSDNVAAWREGMQKATKSNKEAAESWAHRIEANGRTNIYDALEKAFNFAGRGSYDKEYGVAVDTIFLLSDGSANRGRYTKNEDMLAGVARLNSLAKIVINGIAIGSDSGFMRRLAEENRGQFVLVR